MNFVYDPKVAAEIDDYVNYICPVKGPTKVLREDATRRSAKNPLIFPTTEMLDASSTRSIRRRSQPDYKPSSGRSVLGA